MESPLQNQGILKENPDIPITGTNHRTDFPGQKLLRPLMFNTCSPLRFACLTLTVLVPASAGAQESELKYHDKPFAVTVSRVTAEDGMAYLRTLSQRLNVGKKTLELISQNEDKDERVLRRPVSGNLVFLQKALVPSVASLDFEEVSNEDEFRKIIRRYYNEGKEAGSTLEGSGDKFKLKRVYSGQRLVKSVEASTGEAPSEETSASDEEAPEDAPKHAIQINIGTAGPAVKYQSLENPEDGEEYSYEETQYYRHHGDLMYSSSGEQLWTMSLPTRAGVLAEATESVDYGAEVYLDRIPYGLKSMGWSMLFGTVSTSMQQRDGESDVDYNFRSAGGRLALAVAKAGMFDSQHVSASVQFASVDKPIETKLMIEASKGSDLSARLADLSSGQSRFAPILRDDAAVTLHLSAQLPEESLDVLRTGGEYLKDQLIATAGADVDLVISGAEIAQTLGQIADQTNAELFAKLGWTQESGGVIYGGMGVGDNPELLQSVLALLTPESAPLELVDRFAITKRGELDVIEFLIPADTFSEGSPVRLSHLYITHANSCLWFCAGGESSYRILEQSIEACEAAGLRTTTRVFTANLDLQKWLSYPQDDVTGITTLPRAMDRMLAVTMNKETSASSATNLLQRVIDLGGRTDIQVALDASSKGLKLESQIGQTFGSYVVAQYLQLFDNLDLEELEQIGAAPKQEETTE